ncbi:NADH-flavin reductase RutF [Neorhizobium galegae bv. officinalis bv. officinalis str. HAMBI 1141]|jgi:flavin reductase|uniref:NADH-flavin reductase RutF n=1 Tax=Neorhizobium galegae bv. officinalis bv. officinalis str. HAMBI 1141 TaxID=1028801 RepID=A0A068TCG9_NEOGA|nr:MULTISPECIES: flavin reductase [Neorhizobium]MCJ9670610.1 flavin reductase [Neorhizobium sp. SHOUNA12B]MCJ9746909.1 flavin reductase [Neorhizobium sp. SHOUNA12A]CDN56123.1 NADH-flavin reductase RutF [Neorhizobium galegae bv. officinalis bv. officinalis str. HAMBI 1141]
MTINIQSDEVDATRLAFREGMAQLAAAVNIVTTDGPGGLAGFTASAVCSVTDRPPTLLVCLNRSSSVAGMFEKNRVLCVNTLGAGHEPMSRLFGGSTPQDDRFAVGDWVLAATGSPRLTDAVVSFDCEVENAVESGTHHVLFCRVVGIVHGPEDEEALVYFRRRYHHLK